MVPAAGGPRHGRAAGRGVRRHGDARADERARRRPRPRRSAVPSASVAVASPSAPASTIPQGGTLSIAYQSDLQHLDPAVMYDTVGIAAVRLMFEAPLDVRQRHQARCRCSATEMPTVSADGLKYTIKLRTGVNFVNEDGSVLREMKADDLTYSLNRVLDPNLKPAPSPVSGAFFGNIVGAADVLAGKAKTATGIKTIDDHHGRDRPRQGRRDVPQHPRHDVRLGRPEGARDRGHGRLRREAGRHRSVRPVGATRRASRRRSRPTSTTGWPASRTSTRSTSRSASTTTRPSSRSRPARSTSSATRSRPARSPRSRRIPQYADQIVHHTLVETSLHVDGHDPAEQRPAVQGGRPPGDRDGHRQGRHHPDPPRGGRRRRTCILPAGHAGLRHDVHRPDVRPGRRQGGARRGRLSRTASRRRCTRTRPTPIRPIAPVDPAGPGHDRDQGQRHLPVVRHVPRTRSRRPTRRRS